MEFCTLFSGSGGNCIYVGSASARLLIDAGLSAVTIEKALSEIGVEPRSIDGILVTHEHSDHISGLSAMANKYGMPVYANTRTWAAMPQRAAGVKAGQARVFATGSEFYINDIGIRPFPISHDAAEPVGFALLCEGKKICTATDTGRFTKGMAECVKGADLMLLESNHDVNMLKNGAYPAYLKARILSALGHLSNESAAQAAVMLAGLSVRRFVLGHLSAQNNREELALAAVCGALEANGAAPGKDVHIGVAHRDRHGSLYRL